MTLSPFDPLCDEESDPFCMFANFSGGNNNNNGTGLGLGLGFGLGFGLGNGSSSTVADDGGGNGTLPVPEHQYNYWTILLIIFPMFTVFGNVLVVMSVVREKSLKTVTNYFICSLAVADIMVAVVVMPFAVYVEVSVCVGVWR